MHFYHGIRNLNIALTRLRLNCSPLNGHLYKIGVLDSPMCRCGSEAETVGHFLMECTLYLNQRRVLERTVAALAPFNLRNLLSGCLSCTHEENKLLFDAVQTFINNSKRFL